MSTEGKSYIILVYTHNGSADSRKLRRIDYNTFDTADVLESDIGGNITIRFSGTQYNTNIVTYGGGTIVFIDQTIVGPASALLRSTPNFGGAT